MGQAGAVVIPRGGEEHLGLVHEAAEGLAMDDAVAVALELAPQGARLHGMLPSAGGGGSGSHGGQKQGLPLVHPLVEIHIHVFLPFCRPVGVAFFFPSIIYANVLRFTFIFCGNLRFLWEIFLFWGQYRTNRIRTNNFTGGLCVYALFFLEVPLFFENLLTKIHLYVTIHL
jgi:hypothetical protein